MQDEYNKTRHELLVTEMLPWLQIANEPPPLREIPPDCSPLVTEVLKAGLQKEPIRRASAPDLRAQAMRALQSGKQEVFANR